MPDFFNEFACKTGYENYIPNPLIYAYHSPNRPGLTFYSTAEEVRTFNYMDNLYFGVELEFDGDYYAGLRNNKINTIRECNNIFRSNTYAYFMRDGSLRYGLEMITQPSTYDFYIQNREKFAQVFDVIKQHGYSADDRQTCGFHIHFNKDFFKDNPTGYAENLLFAMDRYWPELICFSKRKIASINRWAKKNDKPAVEIVRDMNNGYIPDKYHALNINNRTTFEFRLWHGTLDEKVFFATLTLVKNIVLLAKNKSKEEIRKIPFEFLLDTPEAMTFFYTNTTKQKIKKYEPYFDMLKRRGLDEY